MLEPEQSAEVWLTAMVMGGVFERHPDLTVLISELGIDWLPRLARRLDDTAEGDVSFDGAELFGFDRHIQLLDKGRHHV